jgi:hypothetical protein
MPAIAPYVLLGGAAVAAPRRVLPHCDQTLRMNRDFWSMACGHNALVGRIVDKEPDMIDLRPATRIGRLFRPPLACSFCGRDASQVDRLVAGASAHICDDCITKCLDVLEQHPKDPRLPNEADRL